MGQFENIAYELVILLAIGLGIFLGYTVNYMFYTIPVIVLIINFLYNKNKRRSREDKRYLEIKSGWGKRKAHKKDYNSADKIFNTFGNTNNFFIDDITWRDLNMNSVLERIDNTMSFGGMQYLYNILRRPLFAVRELEERNRIVKAFQDNIDEAITMQSKIDKLGKKYTEGFYEFLSGKSSFKAGNALLLRILSLWILYLPIIFLISPKLSIYAALIFMLLNFSIYKNIEYKIRAELDVFKYLGRLLQCSEEILESPLINEALEPKRIKDTLKSLAGLSKQLKKLIMSTTLNSEGIKTELELAMDYMNMIMLREPIIFYKAAGLLNKQRDLLEYIHMEISKLDAYISVASYRSSMEYYAIPNFIDNNEVQIKCMDIYHPLLASPIANSIEIINNGVLITGSNASGKSTFLRTIGVNAVFAQTICTVLAKSYYTSFFKVLTSIGTVDNILEGDSYFMTEAKSLKRIIDELNNKESVLCILDEIFRGTNTVERISGATSVLKHLVENNSCVIAATHDLELTKTVEGTFDNYHFKEEVRDNDIYFDYKLNEGTCTSRNAILILKQVGYPKEVYEKAMEQAAAFYK